MYLRIVGSARNVTIGDNVFINERASFGCGTSVKIVIGNNVLIGPECLFETSNHDVEHDGKGRRPLRQKGIVVENNVWIGARVTILPGVTVGAGSVIAAGAVVAKDVPPNVLCGGVPARIIRHLNPERGERKLHSSAL